MSERADYHGTFVLDVDQLHEAKRDDAAALLHRIATTNDAVIGEGLERWLKKLEGHCPGPLKRGHGQRGDLFDLCSGGEQMRPMRFTAEQIIAREMRKAPRVVDVGGRGHGGRRDAADRDHGRGARAQACRGRWGGGRSPRHHARPGPSSSVHDHVPGRGLGSRAHLPDQDGRIWRNPAVPLQSSLARSPVHGMLSPRKRRSAATTPIVGMGGRPAPSDRFSTRSMIPATSPQTHARLLVPKAPEPISAPPGVNARRTSQDAGNDA